GIQDERGEVFQRAETPHRRLDRGTGEGKPQGGRRNWRAVHDFWRVRAVADAGAERWPEAAGLPVQRRHRAGRGLAVAARGQAASGKGGLILTSDLRFMAGEWMANESEIKAISFVCQSFACQIFPKHE